MNNTTINPVTSSARNPSNSTTTTSTTTQACAACKYQRRKCAPDCILAPYFPHDRQRQFLNAHKLFGVSNITKIIKNLEPPEKDEAMKTIIFQSDVRASDPVGGCYRIIRELQRQIEYTKAELDLVVQQVELCRAQTQLQIQEHEQNVLSYGDIVVNEDLSSFGFVVQQVELCRAQTQLQIQEHEQNVLSYGDIVVIVYLSSFGFVVGWGGGVQDLNVENGGCLGGKQVQEHDQGMLIQEDSDGGFIREGGGGGSPDQDVKPQIVEIPYERHEIKFENDERRKCPQK